MQAHACGFFASATFNCLKPILTPKEMEGLRVICKSLELQHQHVCRVLFTNSVVSKLLKYLKSTLGVMKVCQPQAGSATTSNLSLYRALRPRC